jgi:hypothetical protein
MISLAAIIYETCFQIDDLHVVIERTFSANGVRLGGVIHKTLKPDVDIALA